MSYTDLDPDYYAERDRQKIQQIMDDEATAMMHYINRERQNAGLLPLPPPSMDITMLEMQFADPDWQPDQRPHVKLDITDEGGRASASRLLSSPEALSGEITFAVHLPDPDPELLYTVYDTESSKWVDVPFHVAWLFYGLFVFMGQLLVLGIASVVFRGSLGFYIAWGILCLLSLPFLSYWWTKHVRDRHDGKVDRRTELLQELRAR